MFTTLFPSTATTLGACMLLIMPQHVMQESMPCRRTLLQRHQTRESTALPRQQMRYAFTTYSCMLRERGMWGSRMRGSKMLPRRQTCLSSFTHAGCGVKPLRRFGGAGTGAENGICKGSSKALISQDHTHLKNGSDVPPEAQLQYLKSGIFAQALIHNKFVFTLPKGVRGDATDLQVMASHAYSYKKFWYVDCDIVSFKVLREPTLIQMPVVRGDSLTTKHKHNLCDLFNTVSSNLPRW